MCSLPVPIAPQQPHDLPLARDVRDLLRGAGRRARRFALGRFAVEATGFHEVLHCLLEAPSTGVQVDVDSDARGTITAEPEDLALSCRVIRIQPFTHQHLFSVERPAFREDAVALHAPDLARYVIRDRYLQEVPGNALVAQDRPRILDGRADVEVAALGVIRRDVVEAAGILVVDARWIHETAGARRLECFRKLADSKGPHVVRNRDQPIGPQELDDLLEARLVSGEELGLVFRYVLRPRRVGGGEARILEHRLEGAVARELDLAEMRHVVGIERQQQDALEEIVVARLTHRSPVRHLGKAGLEPIGEVV